MNIKEKLDEAKIRQEAYFQGQQDKESELNEEIARLRRVMQEKNDALSAAWKELAEYRDSVHERQERT